MIGQRTQAASAARATTSFEGDILIWGASLWGDSDPAVIVAEYGEHYWHRGPLWDTFGESGWQRSTPDGYEPVPLAWSLPWVCRGALDDV